MERIPGSVENYVTGVSECSQQRGNLKDDGYKIFSINIIWASHEGDQVLAYGIEIYWK
ncbi:hypothetical protein Ppb6_01081 [Photorhabdus australis subsp. thailandensis]|uniref:Uncharacterized protein n=1 Tax=Photorhabdus australis subsp. thailandensis TaxID=2805096 RepID=A0A1C0U6X8_9GAMM|nr:hypothetical protein Ppb6_01081 [Photorhabdus australis subsp. thailandensis]